jgi:4-hydroxy 2-oxovalerate aldolase
MLKVLDCTLRDGGYYNNWDFDSIVVKEYLDAIAQSGISFVELGLRNFAQKGFLGAFAYTTEDFLNSLELPVGPTYGVMVDAKTLIGADISINDAISTLFVDSKSSKIGLIRVAAHFHEVENCKTIVSTLKAMGYSVGLNLMQAGGKPAEELERLAGIIESWNCLDCLYFADSLGNMDTNEVTRVFSCIRSQWSGEMGIHTHDNMSAALSNTITAADLGATWLDSTVTGMGRGAGNAQTERLLAILSYTDDRFDPVHVYKLVIKHFEKMQKDYGWGCNLLYFIGAQHGLHPTYIQTLLNDKHYSSDEIVQAIEYLSKQANLHSFDHQILKKALDFSGNELAVSGTKDLIDLFNNREVLIIGSGPSTQRYKKDIELYIEINNPIVISINVKSQINPSLINYYCVSHNVKFLSQSDIYKQLDKPLIFPKHRFLKSELDLINPTINHFDYGIISNAVKFVINETYCELPCELTAAYAFAIITNANAKSVKVVGFDGFKSTDSRQQEMIKLINDYNEVSSLRIESLTPTSYPLEKGSIFAPVK